MAIFEAGAAFRTWAARQNLAPSHAAAQVTDAPANDHYLSAVTHAFEAIDPAVARSINSRKVHAVVANETEEKLIVYVSKDFPAKVKAKLPQEISGFGIEYRHGMFGQTGGLPPAGVGAPSHYLHNARIACGSSIGMGGSFGAGTLGALVRVGDDLFGLSNNHVIGRCNYAEGGHPILAPGNIDINPNFLVHPFTVGVFENSAPLLNGSPATVDVTNNLDASLMRIVDDAKVSAMQGNHYPTPNKVGSLADGMHVKKVGRTTGYTEGVVSGKIAGFQSIPYTVPELQQQFNVFFTEAWIVEGIGGPFSDGGDSGSLVVGADENGEPIAVGLVFAGNGSITLVVPLDLILNHFGATIEGVHGI
jgi:hypothetical protein